MPEGGQFAAVYRGEAECELASPPLLAGKPAPECSPHGLTHVGTLNPDDKQSWSLEGQGLSVSQHPEDWADIARLGGPTWRIGGPEPRFLDAHRLDEEQRSAITDWAVNAGYVEVKPAWKVTSYDDEWEQERFGIFLDPLEAADEAEENEGDVTETTSVVATATFPDLTVKPGTADVDDILATVWVNEVATDFDGVWWEDDYAPELLSAPRGVIVPRAVEAWVASARPHEDD